MTLNPPEDPPARRALPCSGSMWPSIRPAIPIPVQRVRLGVIVLALHLKKTAVWGGQGLTPAAARETKRRLPLVFDDLDLHTVDRALGDQPQATALSFSREKRHGDDVRPVHGGVQPLEE